MLLCGWVGMSAQRKKAECLGKSHIHIFYVYAFNLGKIKKSAIYIMNTNNQSIGKLSNGENVFMRRTGKTTYQYVDGNGNKVDGRKVKKFSKNNTGDTSVEKEKMKKKATPKQVIKKIENEDMMKKKNRDDNLDKKEKMYMEYEKKQLNGQKPTPTSKAKMKKDFNKIWLKEKKKATPKQVIKKKKNTFIDDGVSPLSYENMSEYDKKKDDEFYELQAIEEAKEQKKADEIADKERARLKKLEPKKQTADQLEKRRKKYQENRAKELARKRAYREANKEKINAKQDAYRETAKSVAYQKAYREANAKPFKEPKPKPIINKIIKPRKVRTDKGQERGKYNVVNPEEMKKKYPRPTKKDGESEEIMAVRRDIWDKVIRGKLKPSMLGMKSAVKVAYGDGMVLPSGEEITTSEWIKRLEKGGRNIERDGLGVGNLKKEKIDPDAVY